MQQGQNQANVVHAARFTHNHARPYWDIADFPYSTAVAQIGYKTSTETLMIQFTSGGVYHYQNVLRTIYEDFIQVRNKGRFFHREIKGVYTSERIGTLARSTRSASETEELNENRAHSAVIQRVSREAEDFQPQQNQPSELTLNERTAQQMAQLINALAQHHTASTAHIFTFSQAVNDVWLNAALFNLNAR